MFLVEFSLEVNFVLIITLLSCIYFTLASPVTTGRLPTKPVTPTGPATSAQPPGSE